MKIHLCLERPADHYTIEALTRDAFWINTDAGEIVNEHLLLHRLRESPSFVPELDYVAETDGKAVGNVVYSKAKIVDAAGEEHEVLTFGPLSVLPEYQSRGIGRALMEHTIGKAKRLGYRAIVFYGHPDYYPRLGFRRAKEFGLTTPGASTFDAFMAMELYGGALDGITGQFYEDPLFENLTDKDTLAFNAMFPPKEPHTPVPISVLLERLKPAAQKTITTLKWTHLGTMRTQSEHAIASLPGIDDQAIDTIRIVMREYGRVWGSR